MEIIANAVQTVEANQNVYFTDTMTSGNYSISHRNSSGLVEIRGITNQCRARFKVSFGANVSIPTGETVEPISLAIAINGEAVQATTMTVTPAAVDQLFNVYSTAYVDVPCGSYANVSVKNISDIPVDVQNANLIVDRTA